MAGIVYLSGPITGLSYQDARFGWRETVARQLTVSHYKVSDYDPTVAVAELSGIKVLSPMRHEAHLAEMESIDKHYPEHFFSKAKVIVEKDRLDIKRSDIMLVNLLGATKVSIGTVSEIAMAYEQGKQTVLVMEDHGNVHDHPFVTELVSLRLNNLDDAVAAIKSLLSEGI